MVLISVMVSLDAAIIGASYAARGIKIPVKSAGIMAGISAIMGVISIVLQNILIAVLPREIVQGVGGVVLMLLGIKALWETKKGEGGENYDKDSSKIIERGEALVLGCALATDVACVGITIPMTGANVCIYPLLVGGFMYVGLFFCPKVILYCPGVEYMSGIILILTGIFGGLGL